MQIKNVHEQDLALFFHYAQLENWDIEELHIRTLLKTNPDDFFIFYENSDLLGFVVALKENENFGFISSLLVVEKFRLLGYGKKIFTFALEYLRSRQIALDSVLGQESFYEQFGFSSYFDVHLYRFIADSNSYAPKVPQLLNKTQALARQIHAPYLQELLSNKGVHYRAIIDKVVTSFAFSFPYKDGYKITINTKDTKDVARLFFSLVQEYPQGSAIYIQTTKLSPLLEAFAKDVKMIQVSHHTRMYNKILS